jgi:hypothetical protein
MPYPVKSDPHYNYSGFQAAAPTTPLPGNQVDNDLSKLKSTSDGIVDFLVGSLTPQGVLKVSKLPQAADLTTYTQQALDAATEAAASEAAAAISETNAAVSATAAAASAVTSATSAATLLASSTTSVAVGIGSKSLTVQAARQFAVGAYVLIARTSAPTTTWMYGQVTSYNSGTGALVVNVSTIKGTGTFTDWTVNLSGIVGPAGADITSVLTTQGDTVRQGASSVERVAIGAAGKVLTSNGTVGSWQDPAAPAAGTTWLKIGEVDAVAAASVDFTGIDSAISDLHLLFELIPGTNGVSLLLQTYGADGVLDSGATDYRLQGLYCASNAGAAAIQNNLSSVCLNLRTDFPIRNDAVSGGISGDALFTNIQAARYTRFNFRAAYGPDTVSSLYWSNTGSGFRLEADVITGIRLIMSSGTLTGKVTLLGRTGT